MPKMVKIVLGRRQAEALLSSFDSAERGREDFEYLAGLDQGDYDPEDVADTRRWHEREAEVEAKVRAVIEAQTEAP